MFVCVCINADVLCFVFKIVFHNYTLASPTSRSPPSSCKLIATKYTTHPQRNIASKRNSPKWRMRLGAFSVLILGSAYVSPAIDNIVTQRHFHIGCVAAAAAAQHDGW